MNGISTATGATPPTGAMLDSSWRPFATPLLALVLLAALAEGFDRSGAADRLPAAITYGFSAINVKVREIRRSPPLDIVFLGSSTVASGIEPDVLSAAFRRCTGRSLLTYNLATGGATERVSRQLASLLTDLPRPPRMIVYGTHPGALHQRAAAEAIVERVSTSVNREPWFAHREGRGSLEGWLLDHSAFARFLLGCGSDHAAHLLGEQQYGTTGWDHGQDRGLSRLAAPASRHMRALLARTLRDRPSPADLEDLGAILTAFGASSGRVVLVVLPTQGQRSARQEFPRLSALLDERASAARALVLESPPGLVGPALFEDPVHLSSAGAFVFSRWLAEQLADADLMGKLPALRRAGTT